MSFRFRSFVVFLLAVATSVNVMGADISEDFEAYTAGGGVLGQGIWTTWDGDPQWDGEVSTEQASSGTRSLKIIGDNDVVGIFNKAAGVWEFGIKVFVPANHAGTSFVILMSAFGGPGGSGPDYVWGPQIELIDASTIAEGGASLPLVTDAWAEIKVVADLISNTKTILYNGAVLNQGTWSAAVGLSAVDLYGGSGSSAVYFDDVTLTDVTPAVSEGWTVAQSGVAGRFDNSNPSVRGASAALDGFEPGYVVAGSGGDIWGDWDSFTFAYDDGVRVTGDFDAQVQIRSFTKADGAGVPCEWGRAGLMVREHLGNGSPYAMAGVNGNRQVLSYSRQNNGANFWGDTGDAGGGNTDQKTLPIWMRMTRAGNTYTFYWKQNEGDEWIQLRQHGRAWTPPQMILGFGVQNHNNCRSEAAAIGKFSNLSVTDSTGPVVVDEIAPLGIFGASAVATTGGVQAGWGVIGEPAYIVAERTFGSQLESLQLPGTFRDALDDEAPTGFVTYKLTPYTAGGVAGGAVRTSLWTTGLTAGGHVTTWVTTPLLNQPAGAPWGANPGVANMSKDFLAEGGNGPATEANLLPVPGTTINPDYNGAAASTGGNCDGKYGCSSAPLTFLLAQNQNNGSLDFNDIFNGADNVMNYMIAYVTNHTDADLPLRFNYQTDDAVAILIDNTIWHMDHACCYSATAYGVLPPGEHRLMLKIFEGGGGHNGWCRLLELDGSVFPEGTITVSPYPTMTSVPDAIAPSPGMTIDGRVTDWLLIGQYKQPYGCGPSAAQMAQDFLTEGEGGATEANIVPTVGMEVYTDYVVAASTGCEKGTAAGATCDPITVLATNVGGFDNWNDRGRVNFSSIFGDQDNLMAYMVCYLTNNTDDYVYVNLGTGSDDSIAAKLDNIVVRAVSWCRGYTANQDQGLMAVPPGTHRLMAKVFEGGGGFDGGAFLRDWAGGVFAPGVLSVSLTPPAGFSVPPAPESISDLAVAVGETDAVLTWTNNDTYDRLVVERKAALVENWTVLDADVAGDATSFVDEAPDTEAAAVYYRVTPYVLDGTTALPSQIVGWVAPGFAVYQEGIFPTPAYTGTQDTHIIVNTADSNQGSSPLFEEGDWNAPTGYDHKEALLGFEIAPALGAHAIEGATLGVFFDSSRNGVYNDHTVYIRQVLKQWNQGTGCCSDGPAALPGEASWNNARAGEEPWEIPGAYGATDIAAPSSEVSAVFGATAQRWVTFGGEGLQGIVEDWASEASPNHGLKITQCVASCPPSEPNTYIQGAYDFCSSEHADVTRRPILIVLTDNTAPTVTVAAPEPVALCAASVAVALTATVEDPEGDALTVTWTSTGGTITSSGDPATSATATFTAVGEYVVTSTVSDGLFSASQDVAVSIVECAGGLQKPGDSNQDGNLDISDPVDILGYLFLGMKDRLPCGEGEIDDVANLALLDVNGDGGIDLSDPVFILNFLFSGGAMPGNCFGDDTCPCIRISGCPDICQ